MKEKTFWLKDKLLLYFRQNPIADIAALHTLGI